MPRSLPGATLLVIFLSAAPALAQAPPPDPQQERKVGFKGDVVVRQEWTQSILDANLEETDERRTRIRARPRVDLGGERFFLSVGGDFLYSSDRNYDPPPPLIRDNFKSRDARLDLAFARVQPLHWLRLQGGRFEMPLAFTEMIWDRDLRPQGGAATLELRDLGSVQHLAFTVLGARGSHVFDDDRTNMVALSAEVVFSTSTQSRLHVAGSYLKFTNLDELEPKIRRQNTRLAGALVKDYRVLDLVVRYRSGSDQPIQLVADYCWNTATSDQNRGLWLAAILGSLQTSRARIEYTYARVDRDATLAAYGADDFFWVTGWEGHRVDIGSRARGKSSVHVIGQLQKFKDSARPEERDHWVKRLRLETRVEF